MKKIGIGLLNLSIAFILLLSGMSGLGDVVLNATEITTANGQNESESTTIVGDGETSEVIEETTTVENTGVVEESTAIVKEQTEAIKPAAEPNMAVKVAISEEEQQLLNQLNPRMKSLESEQKDFLSSEDTPESFIVFLKEDTELYGAATEVFSTSAGKSVAPELSTLIVKKDEANLPDEQFIKTLSNLSSVDSVVKNTVSQMTTYENGSASDNMKSISESFSPVNSYGVPNDPEYVNQWEMQQMQMPKVWDLGKGKGVKIGVFDTGFQSAYRDSTGVEFDTNRILPLVRYAEDNTCYSHGEHGTMVLSIAGAVKSNNGIGIAGVAPDATFQPYIAGYSCSSNGFGLNAANFVKVYEHALANGVSIMNMSFGGSRYSEAENTVIQRATSRGLISVAARGNEGRTSNPTVTNYPACYSGVVMVGALTQSNTLADFSTYGDCGNKNLVTAYGENVSVVVYRYDGLYGGGANGTSFSSPITAGVLAVMKSAKPSATATELKNALLSTATDLGNKSYDQKYGYGGINPLVAIQKLDPYVVRDGNYIYYLNKDMTIKYRDEVVNGKKISVTTYVANTKYGSHASKVAYKHVLDASGSGIVKYSEGYVNNKKTSVITYLPNTMIGTQASKMKYKHVLEETGSGKVKYSEEYTNNKKVSVITYLPNTMIGTQASKMKYKHVLEATGSGKVRYSEEYTNNKKVSVITYLPNTMIGTQASKVKYKHVLEATGSGKVMYSEEYTNNKKVSVITYAPNTMIGTQASKMKYKHVLSLDGTGKMQYTEEYSNGKKITVITYMTNTYVGQQSKRLKYVHVLTADGTGKLQYSYEYNASQKKIAKITYLPNTYIGQQAGRVKDRILL